MKTFRNWFARRPATEVPVEVADKTTSDAAPEPVAPMEPEAPTATQPPAPPEKAAAVKKPKERGLYTSKHMASWFVPPLFTTFVRLYVRLRVKGCENLPQEGAFILAANHNSHADTAVMYTALPAQTRKRVVAAAAQDYFFDQGLRQFVSRTLFNVIPVQRDSSGPDPLRHALRALREGYGLLLYPEGTRSRNGELGPFRSGIGRLIALFPHVPVLPVWLQGTENVMPKGKAIPRPAQVTVHIGAPLFLQAEPRDRATWQAAASSVRDAVLQLAENTEKRADVHEEL